MTKSLVKQTIQVAVTVLNSINHIDYLKAISGKHQSHVDYVGLVNVTNIFRIHAKGSLFDSKNFVTDKIFW